MTVQKTCFGSDYFYTQFNRQMIFVFSWIIFDLQKHITPMNEKVISYKVQAMFFPNVSLLALSVAAQWF